MNEAPTVQQLVALLKPYGPDRATRYGLRDPAISEHNPRQIIFLLDDKPSTVERLTEIVARASRLSPTCGADLTLRCYLWDKPITHRILSIQIIGYKTEC